MHSKILGVAICAAALIGCASSKKSEPVSAAVVTPPVDTQKTMPVKTAPQSEAASSNVTTCARDKDKRSMEITNSSPGCKLNYSNFSEKDPVAWSFKGLNHCESVRNQIRGTLETAGFKCDGEGIASKVETPVTPAVAKTPVAAAPANKSEVKK